MLRALLLVGLLGCSAGAPEASSAKPPASAPPLQTAPEASALSTAWEQYRKSHYGEAEASFRAALEAERDRARLGLAHVFLITGRYDEAVSEASQVSGARPLVLEAAWLKGEALRRQGKLEDAEAALKTVAGTPEARRARLLLGEVLVEQGRLGDAAPHLMSFVDDYNADRIGPRDPFALAMVGRAATLLGSPHDANDAFNEAEKSATANTQTLLWRAELFLDNYDQGHAEEVVTEILAEAPAHPEALVWMAFVKLAQTLDFETADELAQKALAVNPRLSRAYFVRASIALRDMHLGEAERHIAEGLKHNPRDLELLSLRATSRFLADDRAGFERAKEDVLSKNPRYTRLFHVIGEYADWEHRYQEIVQMMREALLIDADDPKVRAQLGFNLIRSGHDEDGVRSLRRAFSGDPFNVRVFNTLNLYEKEIPQKYESARHGRFTVRYSKVERPILERYVPDLLDQAWRKMTRAYGFSPETPIGIELYPEREHFAIRTSGLPHTFIQGVCFGRTLAAMSPREEQFNLGMTLWHELAHVFHIELSRSRVPRWFTEGLAEYETIIERKEWRREHDLELYDALRGGRLPVLARMNEAFSHARDMGDMATAYYASSQVAVLLGERFGRERLKKMLELWAQGKQSSEVVEKALGVSTEELDRQFRAFASERLTRYGKQFVPPVRAETLERAAAEAARAPRDAGAVTRYAHALLEADSTDRAKKTLEKALALEPKRADARWLMVRVAMEAENTKEAQRWLSGLVADGHNGVGVQIALADVHAAEGRVSEARTALEAAHRFDPTQAVPLRRLATLAERNRETSAEVDALLKLAQIEQHDVAVYGRLMRLLLDAKRYAEARQVGEAALYVDIEGSRTHLLFAEALAATGDAKRAAFEAESAVLCPGRPKEQAEARQRAAELLTRLGRRAAAQRLLEAASKEPPAPAQ